VCIYVCVEGWGRGLIALKQSHSSTELQCVMLLWQSNFAVTRRTPCKETHTMGPQPGDTLLHVEGKTVTHAAALLQLEACVDKVRCLHAGNGTTSENKLALGRMMQRERREV